MKNTYLFLTLSSLLIVCQVAQAQQYFGVYATNNTKSFQIVDYVIKGLVSQSGRARDTLNVEMFSLFLSPGASEQVGVGSYQSNPSQTYPLEINTSTDSVSSYVKLRNTSKKTDSVVIAQYLGEREVISAKQTLTVGAGETITIFLPNIKNVFSSPLISKKNKVFPGLTLTVW